MQGRQILNSVREEATLMEESGCATFDYDTTLSISRIREHTKTDDVPSVTDEQLKLYRAASVEAAEQYTGRLLRGQQTIYETPRSSSLRDRNRGYFTHRTRYALAQSRVFYLGDTNGNRVIMGEVGSRKVRIPVLFNNLMNFDCCNPCTNSGINTGMQLVYKAGYDKEESIPAGILLGMLKYIAWAVSNPGNEIKTVRNKLSMEPNGIMGSNNGTVASGAAELWKQYLMEP